MSKFEKLVRGAEVPLSALTVAEAKELASWGKGVVCDGDSGTARFLSMRITLQVRKPIWDEDGKGW